MSKLVVIFRLVNTGMSAEANPSRCSCVGSSGLTTKDNVYLVHSIAVDTLDIQHAF